MTPVQHLQNLQSQFSILALHEHETGKIEPSNLDQLSCIVRSNTYNKAFDMVQKTITAIEDEQFADLMNNVNTWKRSTRLTQDTVNAMTRKTQPA